MASAKADWFRKQPVEDNDNLIQHPALLITGLTPIIEDLNELHLTSSQKRIKDDFQVSSHSKEALLPKSEAIEVVQVARQLNEQF